MNQQQIDSPNQFELKVSNLQCTISGRVILDVTEMAVSAGEMVALVGPSGCGKTTLLRAIAGLQPIDSGKVQLSGFEITDSPAEKRRIGLVFQHNALFDHLRVDRNIGFGLRHLPRTDRSDRIDEMLQLVGLKHLARRFPHQLSGGEQQRVALARALAPEPAVVLLDEPFGALDEVLRDELGWEVKAILAERQTASVLVTHDRHEALALGDRVAVMEHGRIVQCATPKVVYDQPASRFVAEFISVSSYLPSHLGIGRLVRPHQLRVSPGGPNTVARVEFLGPAHRYTVLMPTGSIVVADHGPEQPLAIGASCDFQFIDNPNITSNV